MKKRGCVFFLLCLMLVNLLPVVVSADTALPVADILDMDYSQGDIADANGHTYHNGTETVTTETGLANAGAVAFNADKNTGIKYECTDLDFESLQDGFSMEAYFYLADIHSLQAVFSNQENAGFGIEVNRGTVHCCAKFTGNKNYTEVGFAIPNAGCWIHAVMTYDGNSLCVYKDGEKIKTVSDLPATVTIPETVCFNVGADAYGSGIGDCQNEMKQGGMVNCARLYSYALTDSEVCVLYNSLPAVIPAECILKEGDSAAGGVTFGVVSDVHIKKTVGAENARYKKALELFSDAGADSVFVVGDFTDGGTTEQFRQYASICNMANIRSDMTIHESMGNHDRRTAGNRETFVTYTDDAERGHYKINGYHFITLSPDDAKDDGSYAGNIDWLQQQLSIASADTGSLPIFVFAHHQIKDTVMDSEYWYTTSLSKDLFDDYPQVVFFGGHSHISNNNPLSIWQDNFTVVNTATLSYFLPESYGYTITDEQKEKQQQIAQGLLVTVERSEVTIKTYDFIADEYIANQIWTIDTATQKKDDLSSFPYNNVDRTSASKAPYYHDDAEIAIDMLDDTSATFTFERAEMPDIAQGDIDLYYIVTVTDAKNRVVVSEKIWSDFFITPRTQTITRSVSGLVSGEKYTISVVPVNAYGKTGEALKKMFKTRTDEEETTTEVTTEMTTEADNEEEIPTAKSRLRIFIEKLKAFFIRIKNFFTDR